MKNWLRARSCARMGNQGATLGVDERRNVDAGCDPIVRDAEGRPLPLSRLLVGCAKRRVDARGAQPLPQSLKSRARHDRVVQPGGRPGAAQLAGYRAASPAAAKAATATWWGGTWSG